MTASAAGTAASGAISGVVLALILWLLDMVDQSTLIILIVVLAILGGVLTGVPAMILHRRISAARSQASSPQAAYPPTYPLTPRTPPVAAAPLWPPSEPLCLMETSQERALLAYAGDAGQPSNQMLVFLTQTPASALPSFGLSGAETVRLSRVEGENVIAPGNLDVLGDLIERHFSKGKGNKVVLPSVETLVEASGVKNVRRLLDVAREVAQGASGSLLFSVDRRSLPSEQVAILERGAFKILAPQAS